jgi:rSAM/selenodomain-associated transferase 2
MCIQAYGLAVLHQTMSFPETTPGSTCSEGNKIASLSIIIPCWKDCQSTVQVIESLKHLPNLEWIVCTYQPSSYLQSALHRLEIPCIPCPEANRGAQMNRGASHAQGRLLLFHHADSSLSEAHIRSLMVLLNQPEIVGGAFYRKFDERHPKLKTLESFERWHSRTFGTLYGDQSLFVRRSIFIRMGGFSDYPLLEDVDFSGRLRREGKILLLDPPMPSSPRKHLKQGPWKTTLKNLVILTLYRCGFSPALLHRWYYHKKNEDPLNPSTTTGCLS